MFYKEKVTGLVLMCENDGLDMRRDDDDPSHHLHASMYLVSYAAFI